MSTRASNPLTNTPSFPRWDEEGWVWVVDWAEIVPSELDRFHERGRSDTARFLTAPHKTIPL
jgi:hypothetical protein